MNFKKLILFAAFLCVQGLVFASFPVKTNPYVFNPNLQTTVSNQMTTASLSVDHAISTEAPAPSEAGKSQVIALLLCIFLGGLGIHRFYLGYTWQGVVQLLTAGGCGIWALIDLIRIITGDLQPKNGKYTKDLL